MLEAVLTISDEERQRYKEQLFNTALQNKDWERVASLIELNPDCMEAFLSQAYPMLPDSYKFSIPVHCHTHNGNRIPTVRKYVRQARKYMPIEKRIPPEMIGKQEIVVYRAGEESIEKAPYRISWTDSIDVAKWFYDRAMYRRCPVCHLYQGVIRQERIIWFTDGRHEREIMQYNNVRDIVEIDR